MTYANMWIRTAAALGLTSFALRTVVPAYAGLSGFPGLYQIVFQTPDMPDGEFEVTLSLAGVTSPNGAFIAVRR